VTLVQIVNLFPPFGGESVALVTAGPSQFSSLWVPFGNATEFASLWLSPDDVAAPESAQWEPA
jgi:hypothetical protein